MSKIEQFTEKLTREEMQFDIGLNSFGYVYPQGSIEDNYKLKELLSEAGGKPKICDLLNDYETKGKGKSKPEFIISLNNLNDTLIIVENKNTVNKHKSEHLDKPSAYAVDGVLYYAKHFKNFYNIIAIAISGTSKEKYVSSMYEWNKNSSSYIEIPQGRNNILSVDNIVSWKKGNKISKSFNEEEIKKLAVEFHNALRNIGVSEKQKPLFIASILLGLSNRDFRENYDNLKTPTAIIKHLKSAVNEQIEDEIKKVKDINYLKTSLDQVGKLPKLQEIPLDDMYSLKWYIETLENKVLPMMEVNKNNFDSGDALGIFYHEFIKYSGGDGKGLGIVLTPKHISEFMVKLLGDFSSHDKVLDPTCGSGTFLVSAMNELFRKAKTDEEREKIRKECLYGVELDYDMYTLAITNMIIRHDGKSNIHNGSCFDKKITKDLKNKNITKGLINPPYSLKNGDVELKFINNMLNILVPGGIGVAIVPMSSAIGTKFKDERDMIMKNHTLLAVFSMPDDLFQPVAGTNTCIMVWKANYSHNSNKKTFFGFFKDDGFKLSKKLGRIDKNNKWKEILKSWLEIYEEKKIIDGMSAWEQVDSNKEWLAEAYMKTDYSTVKETDFEQTIKDFIAYKVKNGLL